MKLSRRQLIKWGAALGVASTVVASVNIIMWWDTAPDAPFTNLNEIEAQVVNSVAGAAFPSGSTIALDGSAANLDRFFDTLLSSMTTENRKLLKLLLEALQHATLPTHGALFTSLSQSERTQCIQEWLQHGNHLLRGAIQSLVVLLGMGYTAHPTASNHLSRYFRCGFGAQ